jgi:hypothetical protein
MLAPYGARTSLYRDHETRTQFSSYSHSNIVKSRCPSLALNAMKRLLIVIALLAVLSPSTSASGATGLKSELLTSKDLTPQWSRYYIENQDTVSCPESNFRKPSSHTSARIIFVNRTSGTLLLEKLRATANPAQLYDTVVSRTLKCPKTGTKLDGYVTFQQIHSVDLSGISVPHRAFTLSAVVGGANVSGCVVYALQGNIVVAFAELSLLSLSKRQFETTLHKALARVAT